ncbi:MAG: hypothetical protein LBS74_10605 [Oscillospiraceae bacterium]|nr:hypothetical protein [Oscillospiraceae bacterium]
MDNNKIEKAFKKAAEAQVPDAWNEISQSIDSMERKRSARPHYGRPLKFAAAFAVMLALAVTAFSGYDLLNIKRDVSVQGSSSAPAAVKRSLGLTAYAAANGVPITDKTPKAELESGNKSALKLSKNNLSSMVFSTTGGETIEQYYLLVLNAESDEVKSLVVKSAEHATAFEVTQDNGSASDENKLTIAGEKSQLIKEGEQIPSEYSDAYSYKMDTEEGEVYIQVAMTINNGLDSAGAMLGLMTDGKAASTLTVIAEFKNGGTEEYTVTVTPVAALGDEAEFEIEVN